MAANTPPLPHEEGDTFTNEETGIKYQFIGGAWRAVSSKAAEEVADAIGQIDLEKVLTNGNTADESIILTNATDDALLLSPEEARIMVGGVGENVVPKIELRHETGVLDTSIVALELDEDGERFDIECDEKVNNIHFRFEDDVKFELNKTGDAVFTGDVDIKGHLDVKRGINTSGNAYIKLSPKDGDNQLLTIDSGSSYLPMLHLKSYASSTTTTDGEEQPEVDTAARKDVLIVRANGEAELSGHLSVMPGEKDNEAVTYNQLLEVEQEIEALVPSVERGQFEITLDAIDGDDKYFGKFNLLRDYTQEDKDAATAVCFQAYSDCIFNDPEGTRPCQAELEACSNAIPAVGSKVTTEDFGLTRQIKFSIQDINGNNHNWSSIAVGQLIEVFNQEDDSYLIAEITATQGMWYELITISVNPIKYKGSATGVCRVKIFELDLSADPDLDFVRLSGKNKVEDNWKIESESKTHFHVQDDKTKIYWLQDPTSAQHPVTLSYANANYALKTYVDNAVADAVASLSVPTPAKYAWNVQFGNIANSPTAGNMMMTNGSLTARDTIKLARTPANAPAFFKRTNKLIFEGKFVNNNNDRIDPQIMTFWDISNGEWRWKGSADIHYIQYDGDGNLMINLGEQVRWNNVDAGNLIYINIAGFL